MGARAPPEEGEAPIIFTTPFFAAPPPRAPPLLLEADTPPPPSSRVEEPPPSRGRTLGTGRSRDRRSSNPSQDSRVRSGAGSGKIRAPWWESSTEEVSLQLVGGRSGPDAVSSVENSSQDRSRKSSMPAQNPTVVWNAAFSHTTNQEQATTAQETSLFNTKSFGTPSPQTPSSSSSARSSAASSFAYQLRRRVDVRLLRKRFKPAQHTRKQISVKGKASPPLQSPTYGIPKVVEDSRDEGLSPQLDDSNYNSLQAFLDKNSKVAVTSLKLPPPKQLRKTPSNVSSERGTESPSKTRSPSPNPVQSKHVKSRRPGILRSSPSRDVTELSASSQARPKARPFSRTSSRESPNRSLHASSHKKQTSTSSRASPVSPLAVEPLPSPSCSNETGTSETNPFQTDDNYFSTLRTKITGRQGFTPTLSPTEPERALLTPLELPKLPKAELQQETWPGMSIDAITKRQKRGSIFSVFGLPVPAKVEVPAVADEITETSQNRPIVPAMATWPRASVDAGKAQWRRMSEDPYIPHYFTRRRRTNTSSDISPSPALSSDSTRTMKDFVSSNIHNPHFQEHSDNIGPLSLFTPLPPLREDYDRSRRVSIEIPGTPGVHHHPLDTPKSSPMIDAARTSRVSIVPSTTISAEPIPIPGSVPTRRFTFYLPSPTEEQAPDPPPATATTRKRSSVFHDIASELRGSSKRRESSAKGDRPLRRLQRRRSAITPVARRETSTTITSQVIKPIKRSQITFRKPRHSLSFAANPKE